MRNRQRPTHVGEKGSEICLVLCTFPESLAIVSIQAATSSSTVHTTVGCLTRGEEESSEGGFRSSSTFPENVGS